MYEHVVLCDSKGCRELATYKVAAVWSDGRYTELKTYGHSCADHAGDLFRAGEQRRGLCPQVVGETVGETALYRNASGWLGPQLVRDEHLEAHFRSWGSGNEGV